MAALLVVLTHAVPARAHAVEAGADLRVTLTFEAGEVTLVITGVSTVPAPLRVGAQAVHPTSPGLVLALELRSQTDGGTSTASARVGQARAALRVGRAGPHELRVRLDDEISTIPFRVLVPGRDPWTNLMDGAFLLAGLFLVGGVLAGRMSRTVVACASAATATAVVVLLMAPHLPTARPEGAEPSGSPGRPYAQGRFSTLPARPAAGTEFDLTLRLVDGATGRPVDDLTIHHESAAHLIVTSENGTVFRHVHPLRTAPGVLTVRLRLPQPGRYLAAVEIERLDSGGQLISGAFEVIGVAASESPPREAVIPRLTPATPTAGSPVTIEISSDGPIQPWLGMPGHLVVRSQDGVSLAHVHGTATGGSVLSFTLTPSEAGRYLAWVQFVTAGRLVTRSFTLVVAR
ncbi:hypothetical protein ABZ541_14305 [Micromonospora sediminicola]|uniref:hypothetical protein n=1 Tax=Micromonospora sediminicola TaxID=946078 RepID=UPI0033DCE980